MLPNCVCKQIRCSVAWSLTQNKSLILNLIISDIEQVIMLKNNTSLMMLKNFLLFQNSICFDIHDIQVVNIEQTCICICIIYIHTQKSSSGWGLSRGYGYKVNKVIQNKLIFVGVFSQSKCLLQIKLNYQLFYRWSLNYHLYYQGGNIMTFVHCVLKLWTSF